MRLTLRMIGEIVHDKKVLDVIKKKRMKMTVFAKLM